MTINSLTDSMRPILRLIGFTRSPRRQTRQLQQLTSCTLFAQLGRECNQRSTKRHRRRLTAACGRQLIYVIFRFFFFLPRIWLRCDVVVVSGHGSCSCRRCIPSQKIFVIILALLLSWKAVELDSGPSRREESSLLPPPPQDIFPE